MASTENRLNKYGTEREYAKMRVFSLSFLLWLSRRLETDFQTFSVHLVFSVVLFPLFQSEIHSIDLGNV